MAQTLASSGANSLVEGTIVNRNLSAVTVRLERSPSDLLAYSDGYSATPNADGSFHFHDIAPGAYRLTAVAKLSMFGEYGSHSPETPGKILQVKAGDHLRGLSLELFPAPETICGHVVDENGRPLEIDVEEYSISDGFSDSIVRRQARVELPTRRTDSNGYFSFPIPGDQLGGDPDGFFIRAGGVWYPSTEHFSKAVPLAPSSQSASGCQANIQIRHSECTGRVLGKYQSTDKQSVGEYDAPLYGVQPSGALFLMDAHPASREDGVEFDDICQGSYAIVVRPSLSGYRRSYMSPVFQLNGPVTAVALAEATTQEIAKIGTAGGSKPQLVRLSGNLRFEGLTQRQACPAHFWHQIELYMGRSMDKDYAPAYITSLDAQGNFVFKQIRFGHYRMVFDESMHGTTYIKSFTINGTSADPSYFAVLRGGPTNVEAIFSNDPENAAGHLRADYDASLHFLPEGTHPAASVSGRVTGNGAPGAVVQLTAIAYNSARSSVYQTVAAENGSFHFDSVDPGIYRLFTEGGESLYSAYGAKGPGLEGLPIVLSGGQHLKGISLAAYANVPLFGPVSNGQSAHLVIHMATDGASGKLTVGLSEFANDPYVDQCQNLGVIPMLVMIPDPLPADNSGILFGYSSTNRDNRLTGEAGFTAVPPGHYRILSVELMERRSGGNLILGDEVLPNSHSALVRLAMFGRPVEVSSKQYFDWVAPLVTEKLMRLKAEMGLPAAH
ncbi:MAG: carboxypeptidase-like regulatory domain-containing protein [Terracidiphilus sp.]